MLFAVFIETGAFDIVDVKVEPVFCGDPVVEYTSFDDIRRSDRVQTFEMTGFTDSDILGGSDEITVFISRSELAEEHDNIRHLLPADNFRLRQIVGVGSVNSGDVRHIDADFAGDPGGVEQDVTGWCGKVLSGKRLDFPFRNIDRRFKTAGQDCFGVIHAADPEHQSDGLAFGIFFASKLIFRSRAGGDIAVSRGVNDDFSHDRLPSGFAFRNDAADCSAVHDDTAHKGIKFEFHSGFGQHIQQDFFQDFMVDLLEPCTLPGEKDTGFFRLNTIHHLPVQV